MEAITGTMIMWDVLKKSAIQFTQKFSKAWTACAVAMVEGDLTVFTVSHAITAAKTGTMSGLAALALWLFFKSDNKWFHVFTLGLATTVSDIMVHPTHFGEHAMTEAVVTGIGAGVLAYLFHTAFPEKK